MSVQNSRRLRYLITAALGLRVVTGSLLASGQTDAVAALKKQNEAPLVTQGAAAGGKPNVVFILADNVGYGDLGPYGGGQLRGYPTPRADQLAREASDLHSSWSSRHAVLHAPHL